MVLPQFNAEVSFHVFNQRYYYYKNRDLLITEIRPQFDSEACYENCREECCIGLEGPEGPIPGSEFCYPSCLRSCNRLCTNFDG